MDEKELDGDSRLLSCDANTNSIFITLRHAERMAQQPRRAQAQISKIKMEPYATIPLSTSTTRIGAVPTGKQNAGRTAAVRLK